MNREEYYRFKITAFLHDPPLKIENIPLHKRRARELQKRILKEFGYEEYVQLIKLADQLASGVDRIFFKDVIVPPELFKSPFENSPRSITTPDGRIENVDLMLEKQEEILNYAERFGTYEEKFLYMWWSFSSSGFYYVPADTRAPNHSIISHAVRTSAIASSIIRGGLSLVLFTIGPVQDFIKTARKTRDFWAGSYIISYLIWKSLEKITEEYGPDHVVFPSLLEQPWMRLYLRRKLKGAIDCPTKEEISIASFPNRFFAILPPDRDFMKSLEREVKDEWVRILKHALSKVHGMGSEKVQRLAEVYRDFIKVSWVILEIPCSSSVEIEKPECYEKVASEIKKLLDESSEKDWIAKTDDLLRAFKDPERAYRKSYIPTVFYSKFYAILEKFLSAVKGYRKEKIDLSAVDDLSKRGERCNLCGQFPAIAGVDEDGRYFYLENKRAQEMLCPVCLAKREFYDYVASAISNSCGCFEREDLSEYLRHYPSTEEVAMALLKEKLLERVTAGGCEDVESKRRLNYRSVPKLEREFPKKLNLLRTDMAAFSGDPEEYGVEIPDSLREKLRELEGFSRYYTLLVMDGDNMGEWLSGKKNKTFKELMAECNGEDNCRDRSGRKFTGSVALDSLRDKIHPMTPSMHEDFSRRLLRFSKDVRGIVENHYGVLVYSGGDDVFAMLPVEKALSAAKEIKDAFAKNLSSRVTMSAGLVIAHSKHPLRDVVQQAYDAEKRAKNAGRNSFCISVLKRSGENLKVCWKWKVDGIEVVDTIMDAFEIVKESDLGVSRRLFYDLVRVLEGIGSSKEWKEIANVVISATVRKKLSEEKSEAAEKVERFLRRLVDLSENSEQFLSTLRFVSFLTRGDSHEEV